MKMMKLDKETSTTIVLSLLVLQNIVGLVDELKCLKKGCNSIMPYKDLVAKDKASIVTRIIFHALLLLGLVYLLLKRSKNSSSVSYKLVTAIVVLNAVVSLVYVYTSLRDASVEVLTVLYGGPVKAAIASVLMVVLMVLISVFFVKTSMKRV